MFSVKLAVKDSEVGPFFWIYFLRVPSLASSIIIDISLSLN